MVIKYVKALSTIFFIKAVESKVSKILHSNLHPIYITRTLLLPTYYLYYLAREGRVFLTYEDRRNQSIRHRSCD